MLASRHVTAIDIGASKVVLAQFETRRGGTPELVNYAIGKLGVEFANEAEYGKRVAETIVALLQASGTRLGSVFLAVPGQSVFPRYVKLPPVTPDKVHQIVRYEAEQNVPFPIDEVLWDYQLIPDPNGELNVMLVAAKTETVKALTDCVEQAGVEPDIVDVAPMALYNVVRFNYPDLEDCAMILDMGAKSANLIFVEDSRIFSRSIPVSGNAVTQEIAREFDVPFVEAEALKLSQGFVGFGGVYAGPDSEVADRVSKVVRNVLTRLHAEVNRSINFYRSQQGGKPPSLILLTGGSSAIPHADTFFREKLEADVEYLNPFLRVPVNPAIDEEKIKRDAHLLSQVTGLGLRAALSCPVEINLLPPHIVSAKAFRRRVPFFAAAAVGLILAMLCGWAYSSQMNKLFSGHLAEVNKRIAGLQAIKQELGAVNRQQEEARKKTDAIWDVIGRRTRWIELLESIHSCMLDGMWLAAVSPIEDENRNVTQIEIKGTGFQDKLRELDPSDEVTAIDFFMDKLKGAGPFSQVELKESPVPMGPTAYARRFAVKMTLKNPIEAR